MDHEDDVQRLFSWLQTPDLPYREFAQERIVPDRVATLQVPQNTVAQGQVSGGLRQPQFAEPVTPPAADAEGQARSGLLGGAYRDSAPGAPSQPSPAADAPPPPPEGEQGGSRSLDSVFGRLAGTRDRLPDPRERPRPGPGTGPSGGRSR